MRSIRRRGLRPRWIDRPPFPLAATEGDGDEPLGADDDGVMGDAMNVRSFLLRLPTWLPDPQTPFQNENTSTI